jgi:hypothetical protein
MQGLAGKPEMMTTSDRNLCMADMMRMSDRNLCMAEMMRTSDRNLCMAEMMRIEHEAEDSNMMSQNLMQWETLIPGVILSES